MSNVRRLAFVFLVISSFIYGLIVGRYQIFPYHELKYLVYAVIGGDVETFMLEKVSPKANAIALSSKSIEIPCPEQTQKLGVLVGFGQSNIANSGGYRVRSEEVPDVINWYSGKCFEARSPLLGASGEKGDWLSLTAQNLVRSQTYDKVIVVSQGISGSTVAAWAHGSLLNTRFLKTLEVLSETYRITDLIWHQGEADYQGGTGEEQYKSSFKSLERSIRALHIDAPLFLSIASYCRSGQENNPVVTAQKQLSNQLTRVYEGVNTDDVVKKEMRYDNCHFDKTGQLSAANEMAKIISKHHQTMD